MKKPLNGRPPGTSNRSHRKGVREVCDKKGYDPLAELIELIPYLSKEKQASIHLEMLTYLYSKAKIEFKTSDVPPVASNPWRSKSTEEILAALPMTNAGNQPSTH